MTLWLLLLCTGEAQAYDALIGATESDAEVLHGPLLPEEMETATVVAPEPTVTEAPASTEPISTDPATEAAVPTQAQGTPILWDEPSETATATAPDSSPLGLLLMPLGLAALGGALLLRNKLLGTSGTVDTATMTVVARKALGNHSALIVLDVIDLEGQTRRLLVGTGQGSPALVADIGGAFGSVDDLSMPVDTGFEFSSRQTTASRQARPVLQETRTGDGYEEFVPEQRDAAQTLVDQVLTEREGYGKALHAQVRVTA